jgi:hypothetical protein
LQSSWQVISLYMILSSAKSLSLLCVRYSGACCSYQDFLDRGLRLTWKLLNQWFLLVKLKSSLRKFNVQHLDLVDIHIKPKIE